MSPSSPKPKVIRQGVVYRNPHPHIRSIHAWHPSICISRRGRIFVTFDLGEAVEAFNYRTYICRSKDGGLTWDEPGPLIHKPLTKTPATHSVRINIIGKEIVGLGSIYHRNDPNGGLTNRANLGSVPTELFVFRRKLGGPEPEQISAIDTPLRSPAFELCHPIIKLSNGRWLAPTSTWKGWNGEAPEGMKAVALVSRDKGRTWPEYMVVADQYDRGVISWEQSLIELEGGRLLAIVWSFNEGTGRSEPTRFTLSQDGQTFGPLKETGLHGQTAKMIHLGGDRVFVAYRRDDEPGLWGAAVQIKGDKWKTLSNVPLWLGAGSGMSGRGSNADELSNLRFGYPSLIRHPEGGLMITFWCRVDDVNEIRWLRVEGV